MALTNYLMQTVLQSAIFYGWGLGLMGRYGLVIIVPLTARGSGTGVGLAPQP
mgnify:CR=1 FL=1